MTEEEFRKQGGGIPDLPDPRLPESSTLIALLIAVQVISGVGCIIAGVVMCVDAYNGEPYLIGGVIAGVFMFTLAVITAACRKYLRK